MNYGQLQHNTASNRALGLWPFDQVSDWWNSSASTAGSGPLTTAAQQQALAQQNAQIVLALDAYRDKPTPPPWMSWVKWGGLAVGLTVVAAVGIRQVQKRNRRR